MSKQLTFDTWNDEKIKVLNNQFRDYMDVLKWAYRTYGDDIVYASSFGAEGIVLIDIISKVKKDARIIFLDTSLHFKETYELIEKVKNRYPAIKIEFIKPEITLEEQAKWYGPELWKDNPNLCCYLRKVAPMEKALKNYSAWISGLRREQSLSRSKTEYVNKDHKFKKIKICPLIHWKWEDILMYLKLNDLPYNPLHDQGYPSIGCFPCTNPVEHGEDFRAGRWSFHQMSECGLHEG